MLPVDTLEINGGPILQGNCTDDRVCRNPGLLFRSQFDGSTSISTEEALCRVFDPTSFNFSPFLRGNLFESGIDLFEQVGSTSENAAIKLVGKYGSADTTDLPQHSRLGK